jgi:hypothetical protein
LYSDCSIIQVLYRVLPRQQVYHWRSTNPTQRPNRWPSKVYVFLHNMVSMVKESMETMEGVQANVEE